MNANQLWNDHTFHLLLADVFKVRKDATMGPIRLKILLDYVGTPIDGNKGAERLVEAPKAITETETEAIEPIEQAGDEKIPLIPSGLAESVQNRYDKYTNELSEKLKGKAGVFAIDFDINFPVNDIPIMLDILKLQLVCPEGANLVEGIKTQRPGPGGGPTITERGEDKWRMVFQPKQ